MRTAFTGSLNHGVNNGVRSWPILDLLAVTALTLLLIDRLRWRQCDRLRLGPTSAAHARLPSDARSSSVQLCRMTGDRQITVVGVRTPLNSQGDFSYNICCCVYTCNTLTRNVVRLLTGVTA